MIKRFGILVIATLIGLTWTIAHAYDDYRGRWWRTPDIAEQLQLGEAEIRQLDDAFEVARIRMIELKGKVEIEQQKLSALMEKTDFNEAAVREQHRMQEAARTQLADVRFDFLLVVRKIVGHDRFVKLLDIREEQRRQRHADREKRNAE